MTEQISPSRAPALLARITRSLLLVAVSAVATAWGQLGDLKEEPGTIQAEIWRDAEVPAAPALSPEEGLSSITVADGFRVELVASEPLVNDPVSLAWDPDGRIWVVEMRGFMPNVDGEGEEGPPVGRVVVLEDLDGDGLMDRSTVFLDGLVMPRSIAFTQGGVLIGDSQSLWFCKDTNGDLRCDEKRKVDEYAVLGSIELSENGLMYGMDNWFYNVDSDRRLKLVDGEIVNDPDYHRGQWGLSMDDYGRIFSNNNSRWLYADYYPWEYASANPGFEPSAGFGRLVTEDMSISTFRMNPGVNRGYKDGVLDESYRLAKVTSVCGPSIYRGKNYPEEFHGNAFVPEPAGNAMGRFILMDSGIEVYGKRQLEPHPKWGKVEFLGSTDERFRPVNSYSGPDGNLYVVDMYRGILQHKLFLTTFLRKQIIERGLDKPVGYGRIYRIVHESNTEKGEAPNLSERSSEELAALLDHENGWWRDTAQRLLVEGDAAGRGAIKAIKKVARSGSEVGKLHALWTLHGMGRLDSRTVERAIEDPSEWVRVHALRVAENLTDAPGAGNHVLKRLVEKSVNDRDFRVRLQAYQSLKNFADSEFVAQRFADALAEDWDSIHFRESAVSSLSGHENVFMAELRASPKAIPAGMPAAISDLAQALFVRGATETLQRSMEELARGPRLSELDETFLHSLIEAANEKGAVPLVSESEPELMERLKSHVDATARGYASKLDPVFRRADEEVKLSARDLLSPEDLEFANRGRRAYTATCLACHGKDGQGKPDLAPTLDDSPWVFGDETRLALVVAHGLIGPISVNGEEWDNVMPAHLNNPLLEGDRLAAVLSYIRTAWTNEAGIIRPAELEKMLAPYADRAMPWTAEELAEKFGEVE